MIEGTVFLGAVIIGVTRFVQLVSDKETRNRAWIIVFAVIAGIVLALIDSEIGVTDISVAEGIMLALGAAGVVTTAEKVG